MFLTAIALSLSTRNGSSARNVWADAGRTPRTKMNARAIACFITFSLKNMTELQEHARSLAGVANVNAQKNAFGRVEPETDSAGSLHFAELELIDCVRHLTGIREKSHVETGERF